LSEEKGEGGGKRGNLVQGELLAGMDVLLRAAGLRNRRKGKNPYSIKSRR